MSLLKRDHSCIFIPLKRAYLLGDVLCLDLIFKMTSFYFKLLFRGARAFKLRIPL